MSMENHHRHSDSDIEILRSDMAEVKEAVLSMKEIIGAWNDAKGFVKTIRTIGNVLRWTALVGATIGAFWLFIRTGQWIKP